MKTLVATLVALLATASIASAALHKITIRYGGAFGWFYLSGTPPVVDSNGNAVGQGVIYAMSPKIADSLRSLNPGLNQTFNCTAKYYLQGVEGSGLAIVAVTSLNPKSCVPVM